LILSLLLLIALLLRYLNFLNKLIIITCFYSPYIDTYSVFNQISFPADTILFLLTVLLEDSVHLLKIRYQVFGTVGGER